MMEAQTVSSISRRESRRSAYRTNAITNKGPSRVQTYRYEYTDRIVATAASTNARREPFRIHATNPHSAPKNNNALHSGLIGLAKERNEIAPWVPNTIRISMEGPENTNPANIHTDTLSSAHQKRRENV